MISRYLGGMKTAQQKLPATARRWCAPRHSIASWIGAKTLLVSTLALTLTGCVTSNQNNAGTYHGLLSPPITYSLWRQTQHQPAREPRLCLSQGSQNRDVLVEYDEQTGESKRPQRRAYWLLAYSARAPKSPKPEFVNPAAYSGLKPIPFLAATKTNAVPANGYCAVSVAGETRFDLWRDGRKLGCFDLPAYRGAPPAKLGRVLLTPFCAATDCVIIGMEAIGSSGVGR